MTGCGEAIDNFLNDRLDGDGAYILGKVRGIAFNLPVRNASVELLSEQNDPLPNTFSDAGGEFVISDLPKNSQQRVLLRSGGYWPLVGMINTQRSVDGDPIWTPALMDNFVVDLQAKKVDDQVRPGTGMVYMEFQERQGEQWQGAPGRQIPKGSLGEPYYFNSSNWLDKNQHSTADQGSAIFVNVQPGWYTLAVPQGCLPFWGFDLDGSGMLPAFVQEGAVTELSLRCE